MNQRYLVALVAAIFALGGCARPPAEERLQGYAEGEFVYVSSPLGGTLTKLLVQRGDQVSLGQPLFELDDVLEAAARDQAKASLVFSEEDFARQERLLRMGPAARQDYDRARSARDQDQQKLAQAEWNVVQKKQSSPQAGLVYDTLFRAGEFVPAGKPIVQILPPANIKVRAFVPEQRVGQLRIGQPVDVRVDGVRSALGGRITYISPRAEYTPPVIYSRESRSKLVFMIEIRFEPETAAKLHPGQPVDVTFPAS